MSAASDRFGSPSPRRRVSAALGALVIHLAVLILMLLPQRGLQQPMPPALIAFDLPLAASPAPKPVRSAKPTVTTKPQKTAPILLQLDLTPLLPPVVVAEVPDPIMAMLADADAQAAGGGCDLTAPIQAALRLSPAVQRDLPTIPARRRSVANAIALWNQTWVTADADFPEVALDTIRTTIISTIAAASPGCRLQEQGGPRLIFLPGPTTDTVLALGSGQWTWQDVADSWQPAETGVIPSTLVLPAAPPHPAAGAQRLAETTRPR